MRSALVVGQVGLALVLLTGASALAASLYRLTRVELGFRPEGVLTFQVNLPPGRYGPSERAAFHRDLLSRLDALPGVTAAGATSWLPATTPAYVWGTWALTGPLAGNDEAMLGTEQRIVEGRFFEALGVPLLEGRPFDARDAEPDAPPVAVVSRSVEARLFPGGSALGQRITMGGQERAVVGIVGEVAVDARGSAPPTVYHHHAQYASRLWALTYLVAAAVDPESLLGAVRGEVAAADPLLVVHRPVPLAELVGEGRARQRFAFVLTTVFAGLALTLAALGLYGVLAHMVQQRRREIAVRLALGADARAVAARVMGQGMRITVVGLAMGLAGSLALGRALSALVFRTAPTDPRLLGAAAATLAVVALLAALLPAWRATRVPPRMTLAEE